MFQIKGKYTTATVYSDVVDDESIKQITAMVNSPSVTNPVAIMPDTHAGKGCVVGFTMKASDVVCPNFIGVDIGCGMLTARIDRPKTSNELIDEVVRSNIPVGFAIRNSAAVWPTKQELQLARMLGMDENRMVNSIGTLGGGNHFIEFGESVDSLYVTIHTGSRNFGKQLAEYYQSKAEKYSSSFSDVIKGMEYLPVEEYIEGMLVAQGYAQRNREAILYQIVDSLGIEYYETYESVHNFIDEDGWIRKGATDATKGKDIILPFNRVDGIWIMKGKGNPDWNFSAPHGAGRIMSRGQAKRTLDEELVKLQLDEAGVYSSYDPLDEAPDAYKSPDEIKKYIGETADFLFSIKPIINIKG